MKKTFIIYAFLLSGFVLQAQGDNTFTKSLPSSFLSGEEKGILKSKEAHGRGYVPVFAEKGQGIFSQDEDPSLSAPPPGASEDDAIKIQAPMGKGDWMFSLLLACMGLIHIERKRRKIQVD
ncbi:MAG: hypothetical protein LUG18_00755 [Candidatus Azobacteroides sp.]|nr:hypothetical protein [Candidatus Azobacteroides sp.]